MKNETGMGMQTQRSTEGFVFAPSVRCGLDGGRCTKQGNGLDSGLGDERSEGMKLPPASGNNGAGSGCDACSPRKDRAGWISEV
jgi:hypothetical protein